jgi:hypothetical protein
MVRDGSATVLARRAPLGDLEAWEASGDDLRAEYGRCSRVCLELGRGDVDAAVRTAAVFCGDYDLSDSGPVPRVDEWLRETRAELARKGGA